MPGRNSELIRQWSILRALASNRRTAIVHLAGDTGKTERTVRRDQMALEAAGFSPEEDQDATGKF